MTVKELIEELQNYSPNLEVTVRCYVGGLVGCEDYDIDRIDLYTGYEQRLFLQCL